MNNEEKLKESIDKDININNNYNVIKKKIEKHSNYRWIFVPICLLVIVSGCIFLNFNYSKNMLHNNIQEKNIIDLKINNIDDNIMENNPSDDFIGNVDELTKDEIYEEIKFTKDINISSSLDKYRILRFYDGNKEPIAYELMYFIQEEARTLKEIDIFFSEQLTEIPSCFNVDLSNYQDSQINNTTFKVLKSEHNYYVKLKYNNYNFDITAYKITEDELIKLLLSIIK